MLGVSCEPKPEKRTKTKSAFYTDMSFNKGIGDPPAILLNLPEDIPVLFCPNPEQLNTNNVPALMNLTLPILNGSLTADYSLIVSDSRRELRCWTTNRLVFEPENSFRR